MGGRDGGRDLAEVAHRLDQHRVDAAVAESEELLGEEGLRLVGGHGAERREQLTGRAEVAGDQDAVPVRDLAGDAAAGPVELVHPVLEPVHLQPGPGAAEGVRGEELCPGGGVRLVGARTTSGRSTFHSSPAPPSSSPLSCSRVPMAPSMNTGVP